MSSFNCFMKLASLNSWMKHLTQRNTWSVEAASASTPASFLMFILSRPLSACRLKVTLREGEGWGWGIDFVGVKKNNKQAMWLEVKPLLSFVCHIEMSICSRELEQSCMRTMPQHSVILSVCDLYRENNLHSLLLSEAYWVWTRCPVPSNPIIHCSDLCSSTETFVVPQRTKQHTTASLTLAVVFMPQRLL